MVGTQFPYQGCCQSFAQAGYVALAPDLYHGEVATEPTEARKLAMALDRGTALTELDVAAKYLLNLASTEGDKVGIVGFCLGGGIAQSFRRSQPFERSRHFILWISHFGCSSDPSEWCTACYMGSR